MKELSDLWTKLGCTHCIKTCKGAPLAAPAPPSAELAELIVELNFEAKDASKPPTHHAMLSVRQIGDSTIQRFNVDDMTLRK